MNGARRTALCSAGALLISGAAAFAQDFGVDWIDRVSREMQEEVAPLRKVPASATLSGGLAVYYDTNVFLEEDDEDSDLVVIPWGRVRIDYGEPQFDAVADLLVNYKWYADQDDASDDEERFYGRARYAGASVRIELAELLRRESDPIDAVFAERVERIVSNTFPRVSIDLSSRLVLEAAANVQLVRFAEERFQAIDNLNWRADLSLMYRASDYHEVVLQVGMLSIDYDDSASVDSDGWYGRVGFRGELSQTFATEVYVGWSAIESDTVPSTGEAADETTFDAGLHVRWEASPNLTVLADYGRRFGFATGLDPFETIDRAVLIAEHTYNEFLLLRVRGQFDKVETATGLGRDYWSVGAAGEYRITSWLLAEGGATVRAGSVSGGTGGDFDDMIVHAGVALRW